MKAEKDIKKIAPIHPGKILLEEFLMPMKITQYRLAKEIGVPARRINEIVHGGRGITPDTSLRLAKFFGMSELFWLNLQNHYDVELLKDKMQDVLENIHNYSNISVAS